MSYDALAPTGQFPRPAGRPCPSCGRTETEPNARFCGSCGAPLQTPSGGAVVAPPASAPRSAGVAAPGREVATYPSPSPAPAGPAGLPSAFDPSTIAVGVPRLGVGPLARLGMAVGATFSLLPCLVFAFLGSTLLHWVRNLLDGWLGQEVRLPLLGSIGLPLNFVRLLGLEGLHASVRYWDDRLLMTFALLWLVPWIVAIIGSAIFAVILALVYNTFGRLGGGVQVELTPRR